MKKTIMVIATIAISLTTITSCVNNKTKNDTPLESSKVVDELPAVQPIDTSNAVDTSALNTEVVDTVETEVPVVYTTLVLNNNALPVELYESDSLELPSDSILTLAGIVATSEGNTLTVKSDSSIIPNNITFSYDGKGKVLVTQFGKTTEYNSNSFSMNKGIISIGDKKIMPEKVVTILKIGVPKNNPVIFNGTNVHYKSDVVLGKVEITTTGNSIVDLSRVQSASTISAKGNTSISIDYVGIIEKIAISDSAKVTMKNCDSVFTANVIQKGKLQIPEKTPITKEKTAGNGDIVKK
jgi:lipopolysaccharide export system protein LptA